MTQGDGSAAIATHRGYNKRIAGRAERVIRRGPSRHSHCCAWRLAPGAGATERAAARQLPDNAFIRALRHGLGDKVELDGLPELFAAAARIRHPGADDEAVLRRHGDLGPDAARVARFDWHVHGWQNVHQDKTYRFHDLIADAAPRLLALGLIGKEPGQVAIAVDALVLANADDRLDVAALGLTLRRLFATPMPKAARLAASLRAGLRADAGLRGAAFALLAEAVLAEPAPRG